MDLYRCFNTHFLNIIVKILILIIMILLFVEILILIIKNLFLN